MIVAHNFDTKKKKWNTRSSAQKRKVMNEK